MKIFISYGHDDHTMLVDRLFDSLIKNGHEPWKDDRYEGISGIPAGEDFTNVIYSAIDESDFVIAFLSRNTQERPYCRDERQYAYNKKGTHFIQILIEDVAVTLGNAKSYIDMRDVENGHGGLHEKLFENKLQALYAALRDPKSFANGGFTPWTKFDTHLKVTGIQGYEQWVTMPEEDDFVGREWLRERCRNWVLDDSFLHRVFVIFGEAGTGKSAFVRRLATDRELVKSVHVCIYDKPCTRRAVDTVKDLAYVLAQNNEAYFEILKKKPLENLSDLTLDSMFEFLFVEPLRNEQEKYLLIIDGLDELEETVGFEPLVRLLRQYSDKLNSNVSILLTARPDEKIVNALRTVGGGAPLRQQVTLDADANRADLEEYIRCKLAALDSYSDELAAQLLDACDGNFEYLSLFFKEVREDGLRPQAGMTLPRGLNERYAHYLARRFGEGVAFNSLQKRMLTLLCAAYEPLPLSLMAQVLGKDEYDVEDALREFRSLIRLCALADGEQTATLFTKGFRDFLLEGTYGHYRVDRCRGVRELAEYVLTTCRSFDSLCRAPYWEHHAFAHLLDYADVQPDTVEAYIRERIAENREQAVTLFATTMVSGDASVMCVFCERQFGVRDDVIKHLKAHREADTLSVMAELLHEIGEHSDAWVLQGVVLLFDPTPDTRRQAGECFRKALVLDEESYAQNPCYESCRSLSVTYNCLGDLAEGEHTREGRVEAKEWCLKMLALDEENYEQSPCYESRRDLSVTYNCLGDLAKAENTHESCAEAKKWYLKMLALDEENYAQNPCYESRRDLGVTYERLGDLAEAENTPEGRAEAKAWYLKMLALNEENHKQNPCYDSRRELSVTYGRLGDLAKADNTPEGRIEAKEWFLKKLALNEENYAQNPCYDSRQSLGITYNRLGDLAKAENTPEGRAEAKEWFLKKLTLNEENHAQNPCYESRRSLGIAYDRLGDLAKASNTPEGRAEAKEWYLKMLTMSEENYRDAPSYDSRWMLSMAYGRLCMLILQEDTPEDLAEAKTMCLKKLALDRDNYREDPRVKSEDAIRTDYSILHRICKRQGTPATDAEASEWLSKYLSVL